MASGKTEALNQEAADWFARLQRDASPEAAAAFEAWVAQPAHAVAYARVEATWERSGRLAAAIPQKQDKAAKAQPAFVTRRMAAGVAIGLALAGAAGGGVALWSSAGGERHGTRVGERRTVVLADGSRVTLNTASLIAVEFTPEGRHVRLIEGEASFDVAKDKTRPFVVEAGEAQVHAVGTAFNIRLRGEVAEVTVTEGVVAVRDRGRAAERLGVAPPPAVRAEAPYVAAGSGVVVGAGAVAEVALDSETLRGRTLWQDGLIELNGETLEQAAAEFNRYSKRKLVVGDPRLASLRVGGAFGVDESDKFVAALQSGFGVRVVEGAGGVVYLVPGA